MAALNSSMLSATRDPVNLPREKVLFSCRAVSLSLFPLPPGAPPTVKALPGTELTATLGTVYATNQRIVYVAPRTSGAGGSGGADGGSLAQGNASVEGTGGKVTVLQTLSVPLEKLVDGRLIQPWFTASYYEAVIQPSSSLGALPEPHLLRLYFRESGGFDFHQTVQEMRERLAASSAAHRRGDIEPLPLYTPASPSSSTSSSPPSAPPASLLPPTFDALSPPPASERSEPSPVAFEAAAVARAAEEVEAEERGAGMLPPGVREGEAPPGYED